MAKHFMLLLLIGNFLPCYGQPDRNSRYNDSTSLVQFVRIQESKSSMKAQRGDIVAFLIRFVDFGCVICLNNFLAFCDSINLYIRHFGKKEIILIFMRDDDEEENQMTILKRWAKANRLSYPMYLAPGSVFAINHIQHTSVAVIDSLNTIEFLNEIPLTLENEEQILNYVFRSEK